MIGNLSTFSPAVASTNADFINSDPFWISLKKNTTIFILGRNTLTYKDKNNNDTSVDISFVTTNYQVPFHNLAKSGYIPTSLLNFSSYQPVNAFLPSIPNYKITSNQKPNEFPGKFKKWWKTKEKMEVKKEEKEEKEVKKEVKKEEKAIRKEKDKKSRIVKKGKEKKKSLNKLGGSISYRKKKSKVRVSRKKTRSAKTRISRKKKACKKEKISSVMKEFKTGKLKMRNGKIVSNRKQAIAIALSESDRRC